MSKESQLARKPGETTTLDRAGPFDLTAMQMMADKIPQLQEFMNKNLKQGKDADWEYVDVIWKRTLRQGEDRKAALLDPGVAKIMNYMQMRPRHRILEKEIDTRTNNLRYAVAVEIVPYIPIMYHNPITNGMEPYFPVVAEGVGSATTREKRYRVTFEYFKERDLKAQGWTEEELEKFKADNSPDFVKGEAPTRLFYLPTAESLGADNTLLKMASKRAEMDAVFQLPGVAGRYSQEIDLKEDRGEEKTVTPPVAPPKQEAAPPAERPDIRKVNLGDPVEKIIADIQAVNKGLSRAQILQKIAEEKAKAAGLLTDEAAAVLVASTLVKQLEPTGFKSASELPKMPPDFRLEEKAAYTADFIVENFSQPFEAVRAMIYAEMQESHLSDAEAAAQVQRRFEERSKPPEDNGDAVYDALQKAALDGEIVERMENGAYKPKKFLSDRWADYNFIMRGLGFEWIRDGSNGRWEKKG